MCTLKLYTVKRSKLMLKSNSHLFSVPHPCNLCVPHLLLQLKDPIHQRFRCRRTSRHININRYNPITASRHTITVVIVTTTIRTATHRDNPSWIWHLIVNLSQCRCHLICESSGNNHNIGLARGSTKNYAKSILVIAGCGQVHHFDGAAGKSESHGPERALTCPVSYLVQCC